jgi:HK97 gp10 family phage protein
VAIVKVEIENIDEIVAELALLPERGKAILHSAVNKGAEYLSPKIQGAIGRGEGKSGKHLKDVISVRKAKVGKRTFQKADVVAGKGKTVDYGFHVEVGTRKMEGKSFMRRTTDAEAETVANIVMDEIERALGV